MATFLAHEMQLTLQKKQKFSKKGAKGKGKSRKPADADDASDQTEVFNIMFNLLLGQQQQSGCDNEAHQIALSQNSSGMIWIVRDVEFRSMIPIRNL